MDNQTTFQMALKMYAYICLGFMPITLVTLIILDRKTSLLKKWNNVIDFFLLPRKERKRLKQERAKAASQAQEQKTTEKQEEKKSEKKSEKDDYEKQGVAYLVLRTGDTYTCYPNSNTRIQGSNEWTCAENFTGSIDKNGRFKAKRAGKANILYNESLIYRILVEPSNKKWFAQKSYEDILEQHNLDDTRARLVSRQIISIDDENGTVTYGNGQNRIIEETYQKSEDGTVIRALFKIQNKDDETMASFNSIIAELDERFEQIPSTPSKTYRIWYHENYDDSVDAIAFLKIYNNASSPVYVLGIERSWRINGKLQEIQDNLKMIEKSFKDCLGQITLHEPWIDNYKPEQKERKTNDNDQETPATPPAADKTEPKPELEPEEQPTITMVEAMDYNTDDPEPTDYVEEGENEPQD